MFFFIVRTFQPNTLASAANTQTQRIRIFATGVVAVPGVNPVMIYAGSRTWNRVLSAHFCCPMPPMHHILEWRSGLCQRFQRTRPHYTKATMWCVPHTNVLHRIYIVGFWFTSQQNILHDYERFRRFGCCHCQDNLRNNFGGETAPCCKSYNPYVHHF